MLWEPGELTVHEWLVIVKERHIVVARQTFGGAVRDAVIKLLLDVPTPLGVRLFGSKAGQVVASGRCSVSDGR
jgi:hypothetical protein